jgi:hypothetical protein
MLKGHFEADSIVVDSLTTFHCLRQGSLVGTSRNKETSTESNAWLSYEAHTTKDERAVQNNAGCLTRQVRQRMDKSFDAL